MGQIWEIVIDIYIPLLSDTGFKKHRNQALAELKTHSLLD